MSEREESVMSSLLSYVPVLLAVLLLAVAFALPAPCPAKLPCAPSAPTAQTAKTDFTP